MIAITRLQPKLESNLEQNLDFEQFLQQCPENERYELVYSKIVKILATREHYDVAVLIMDAI